MKIILLTEFFPSDIGQNFTGGVETRVFYLSRYLTFIGNQAKVIYRTNDYSFNSINTLVDRIFYFLMQLVKIIFGKIERADIIEGTNFTTYILAYLWAKKIGAKAISWWPDIWGINVVGHIGLASGIIIYLTEKVALRLPWDGVIALSKETKRKLVKSGIDEKKIKVIYGGVNPPRLAEASVRRRAKSPNPTLACISRLVSYKRVGDLILAVYLLKEKIPDIKVFIIGEGPEKRNLKLKIKNLKLQNHIDLLGRISESRKYKLLSHSHLHILPSVVEGFGLVTIESLSAGTPVVNTDILINKEVLEGEKGGLLFKSKDYVDLVEKIEMLLTDQKLYNQKIEEGKELIKQYDWEKVNRQTEKYYQYLLSH